MKRQIESLLSILKNTGQSCLKKAVSDLTIQTLDMRWERLGTRFHNTKSGMSKFPIMEKCCPCWVSWLQTVQKGLVRDFYCNSWLIPKKKRRRRRKSRGGKRKERKDERQCQKMKTHFSSSIKARCILGPVSRQLHNGNILESFF
jgi:hypothetical protein